MVQKLINNIVKTDAPIVVGLDPTLKFVPQYIQKACFEEYGETLKGAAEAIWQFNKGIIDATYDLIPAVKPQIAMYEQFDEKCVARALLPPEIMEGSKLKYEMMSYSMM